MAFSASLDLRSPVTLPTGDAIGRKLVETLYVGQQGALALGFGLFMRLVQTVMEPRSPIPSRADLDTIARRYRALLDADLDHVARGLYPRELLFQFPALDYLRTAPRIALDAPLYLLRYFGHRADDLPAAIDRDRYPAYYLRNFHWQTDGWFSDRSAAIYDLQVELLFGGTADVMRRMAIPPVVERARGEGAPLRVLDLACGTGRFLLQLRRALPDAAITGVDLSGPYVERARRMHARAGTGVEFVEANAESLPLESASFDVVTSVFLFHELPKDARRRVLAEAFRVLPPGGTLVLLDAAQPSESPAIEFFLRRFPALYHEPYFKGYLADDLGEAAAATGFVDIDTRPFLVSKRVVARKPAR